MTRAREHLEHIHILLWITIGISFFLVASVITLISLWAHDEIDTVEFPEGSTQLEGIVGNPSGQDFLGIPDWNTNLIAYHAALMVGGYFVAQILAIVSWSVFSFSKSFGMGKIAHVFFLTIALGAVISGLVAVVRFKHQTQVLSIHHEADNEAYPLVNLFNTLPIPYLTRRYLLPYPIGGSTCLCA